MTTVTGKLYKFTSKCNVDGFPGYFELKWTNHTKRFEIEFEEGTPPKFKDKPNIPGWDILR